MIIPMKKTITVDADGEVHTVKYCRGAFGGVAIIVDGIKYRLGIKNENFNEGFVLAGESAMLCVKGTAVSVFRAGKEYI